MSGGASIPRELADPDATEGVGALIAERLAPGDVVLLEGPLGSGKTTLVRGLVAALGGNPAEVCSPTYVLLETYEVAASAIRRVHHADLYRLRGRPAAPLEEVGLGEVAADPVGVMAIEWPEEWPWLGEAGAAAVRVRLEVVGEHRRVSIRWPEADGR